MAVRVKLNDFEKKMFERAFGSAALIAIVPVAKIRSQLPQDTPSPYIRGFDSSDVPWTSKCQTGFESTWQWHVWSDYAGQKEVNEICDILIELFDNNELDLATGKNVLLQFGGKVSSPEPDGVTHHAVVSIRALSS